MVNLKSAQRVLFVCGKENYRRQILLWDSPENLKPVHAGHLHIEENNVRRKGKNFLNCRGSILTLSNNFDIPELLQSSTTPRRASGSSSTISARTRPPRPLEPLAA